MLCVFVGGCAAQASWAGEACRTLEWRGTPVTVCVMSRVADVRLFLDDASGEPLAEFDAVKAEIGTGETLVMAMNAGMYHRDRSPVGLYVKGGVEVAPLVTSKGPGNFHMMPNGVFGVVNGKAFVLESLAYDAAGLSPDHATQSGPMLVIDGALHPRFLPTGTSRKIRNGVGVSDDAVVFAISDAPINFHDFATLFRDGFGASNALYLDGTVSRLYIEGERDDRGAPMGPILGVVEDAE